MNLDNLLALLITVAVCALLAFLAALLLRTRHGVLAYIGAGLFGQGLGLWASGAFHTSTWPGQVTLGTASVHLLWTFLGALVVLAVFRLVPRMRK